MLLALFFLTITPFWYYHSNYTKHSQKARHKQEMKFTITELYNLFCAVCVRLDPSLPLLHHSNKGGGISFIADEEIISKLHDLAFDHLSNYKRITELEDCIERKLLVLNIIDDISAKMNEYVR